MNPTLRVLRRHTLGHLPTLAVVVLGCALLGSALLGCGGSSVPEVSMGAGTLEFVPLRDGDPIDLRVGPQGGVMFTPVVHARGIHPGTVDGPVDSPENPAISWQVMLDAAPAGAREYRTSMMAIPGDDGTFENRGFVVLDGVAPAQVGSLVGKAVTLTVSVTDRDGLVLTQTLQLVASLPTLAAP